MNRFALPTAVVASLLLSATALADVDGYWKTVDDETGNIRSVVHIVIENNVASGKIIQLYRQPDEEKDPLCDECEDELFNKPIVGMQIIKGLTDDGETWSGGTILDPNNGSTYKCYLTEDGDKLGVRGYIGFSFIGRTQTWHRISTPDTTIKTYLLDAAGTPMPLVYVDGRIASDEEIKAHLE